MFRRIDAETIERIFVLKTRDRLSHDVIAQRLGISIDRVQHYISKFRREGRFNDPVLQKLRAVD